MATETEIKIRLQSDEQVMAVISLCGKLYGEETEELQRDEYFDTIEEVLKAKDFTLRLRLVSGKAKVALMGPRDFFPDDIHRRIDLEFGASSEAEVREEIRRKGFVPTAIVEKRRRKFVRGDLKVTIDKLPFIGTFLEIEAPTPNRIRQIIALLQLSNYTSVRKNYSELIEERLTQLDMPLRPNLRATFEAEAEWASRERD
jgi:predicted adenylyl cyclase CyaB